MNIVKHARDLVSKYLVIAGESVVDVRRVRDSVLVDSQKWTWRVDPAPVPVAGRPVSSDWVVYDVTLDLLTDPAQRPDGFAVFADGRVLRLTEKSELSEFWLLVGASLAPGDLATLLTRYQSTDPPAHMVRTKEDLDHVVGIKAARSIIGLTDPHSTVDEDGSLVELTFCTWHVVSNEGGGEDTITVDRWQVCVVAPGRLTWKVTTLAQRIPWLVGI